MIIIEFLLYLIAIPIFWVAWRITWWLYPKQMSRKDKYRTSEYDYYMGRVIKALSISIIFGGVWVYFVYSLFHPGTVKN